MPAKRSQQNHGATTTSKTRTARSGTLYVVATPIGHLDDVTIRAIRTLKMVDLIASEDPHATQQLLAHHRIHTTVTSYGPTHLREKVGVLLQRLRQGADVALVSDCGSPLIADPGSLLVAAALDNRMTVVPVPGPSAVIAALTTAGMPCDSFFFGGDLSNNQTRINHCLTDALKRHVPTLVFCTVPSAARAVRTLMSLAPRRRLVLACDLTRVHERIVCGTARQVNQELPNLLGQNLTLIVAGTHVW